MLTLLLGLLVVVLLVGLIVGFTFWLIDFIPIQAPYNRAAKAIIAVIGILVVLLYVLPRLGVGVGSIC